MFNVLIKLVIILNINEYLIEGDNVDIIFICILVRYIRLFVKMKTSSISLKIVNIVKYFYQIEYIKVKIGNSYSEIQNILFAIPHRSLLGPLLFLIFLNDLSINIKSTIRLFADDVKLLVRLLHHHQNNYTDGYK